MKSFLGKGVGRSVLVHLTVGDDVFESISKACSEHGIDTGIVTSGIGSLRRLHYHYILSTDNKPEDRFDIVESPMELVSLQGVILEGEPHLHILATESGSKSYAGHLEIGTEVQYLVEISIVELLMDPIGRRADQHATVTHFEWLTE